MSGDVKTRKIYRYKGLSRGVVALFFICSLDMFSTLFFARCWGAREWNPLMAWALEGGTWVFVAAKMATYVPAVIFLEWYRRYNPCFVRLVVRSAICAYLVIYLSLINFAN
jgi:hypothetical protein